MLPAHSHEVTALRRRVEVLELELQRAREIVSWQADEIARLTPRERAWPVPDQRLWWDPPPWWGIPS